MCGRFHNFHKATCSGGTAGFSNGRRYSMRCGWARGLVTHTLLNSTQNSPGCGSLAQMPMWSKARFMFVVRCPSSVVRCQLSLVRDRVSHVQRTTDDGQLTTDNSAIE